MKLNKISGSAPQSIPSRFDQRRLLQVGVLSLASLSPSQHSGSAFSPLVCTTTSSSLAITNTFRHHFSSRSTASFVSTSAPLPKCHFAKGKGGNLYVNQSKRTHASLVLRSAVIQSYRVEDDQNVSHPRLQSDAFSLLPSRLSSIKRIETPSQFQSLVLDEKDSLVVVRFFAGACPSCKATSPLFRRWSRDNEALNAADSLASNKKLEIKILEMPLNKATSSFMQEKLHVDQLPYCHLYHPQMGLVEGQLVMNKFDFNEFIDVVDKWAKGLPTAEYDNCVICSKEELMEDCEEFC